MSPGDRVYVVRYFQIRAAVVVTTEAPTLPSAQIGLRRKAPEKRPVCPLGEFVGRSLVVATLAAARSLLEVQRWNEVKRLKRELALLTRLDVLAVKVIDRTAPRAKGGAA